MNKDLYTTKQYSFFNIVFKLILLNILFVVFCLIGLGIFTFMPALVALFLSVKTIIEDEDFPILKTFWLVFKKEYIKSQLVFLLFALIGGLLYFNYTFFLSLASKSTFMLVGSWVMVMLLFVYLFAWIHVIPIYIYFPYLNPFRILKYSILLPIAFPFQTFAIFFIFVGLYLITGFVQLIIPVYMILIISTAAYIILKFLGTKYDGLVKDKPPLSIHNYL